MKKKGRNLLSRWSLLRAIFAEASDTVRIVGFISFVVLVVTASLVLVRVTYVDDSSDESLAVERSSVTMPSESDLFADLVSDGSADDNSTPCGSGRVDLLTASKDEINAVRGLRQIDIADLVVANREFLVETADLVRIGISDAQVGRLLLSLQTCIGDIAPDGSLPTPVCEPDDVDINTAFLSELTDLQGIDEDQAEILINTRPFENVMQISTTEGILERTITWLALNGTCLRQIQMLNDGATAVADCSERVDLNTASIAEIADVRGLFQQETAEKVFANQGEYSSIQDLLDIGVDPGRAARLMISNQACFGDVGLEAELPSSTCAADDMNLNDVSIIDLLDTFGVTHDNADLVIFGRPFSAVDELISVPDLEEPTIVWLSIRGTCFGPEAAVDGLCAPGRINLETASLAELVQIRGIRRQSIAELIFANRESIDGLESLLTLGIEPTVAGKILRSQQACFGDHLPESDLPDDTCGPLGLDLNSSDISELVALDGLTHQQADLIITGRPFVDPSDLLKVRGLDAQTTIYLALIEACIEPAPVEAG